ncbi:MULTISPECIES: sigma factor [Paenibacillus]|uniref:sigma factor n=1 Tax=Paenibacillus TaxID=44249 RepID=UPI0004B7D467|nr:sigma factor [Paenibacillus sp. IHBB 10380]
MLLEQMYTDYRPLLFSLAYRMLGSAADAEDIVQDVFSQFVAMDQGEVSNVKAYLAKMTTNRCINLISCARPAVSARLTQGLGCRSRCRLTDR